MSTSISARRAADRVAKALEKAESPAEIACGALGATVGFVGGMFAGAAATALAVVHFPPASAAGAHASITGAGAGGALGATIGIKLYKLWRDA